MSCCVNLYELSGLLYRRTLRLYFVLVFPNIRPSHTKSTRDRP